MTQGRNERCACGSGKKFKRCCIDKPAVLQPKQILVSDEQLWSAYHEAGHTLAHVLLGSGVDYTTIERKPFTKNERTIISTGLTQPRGGSGLNLEAAKSDQNMTVFEFGAGGVPFIRTESGLIPVSDEIKMSFRKNFIKLAVPDFAGIVAEDCAYRQYRHVPALPESTEQYQDDLAH